MGTILVLLHAWPSLDKTLATSCGSLCCLPAGDCWEAAAEGSTLSQCLQGVDINPTPASRDQVLSPYLLHIRSCIHSRNCSSSCNPRPVLAGAGNTHTVPPCLAPGWWAAKAWEEIREITLFLFTACPHHAWGFELTCTPPIQEALIYWTVFSPCLLSYSGEHCFSEKSTFIPLSSRRSSCSCHSKYLSCPRAQYNKQCPVRSLSLHQHLVLPLASLKVRAQRNGQETNIEPCAAHFWPIEPEQH